MKLLQHGADLKHSDLEATLIKWGGLYKSELRGEHTGTSFPSYLQQDPGSWISLYREVKINDEIADTRFNIVRMYVSRCFQKYNEGRYLMKKAAERCKELQQQVPCELNDGQLNNIAYIYCRDEVGMYREALDIWEKLVSKEQGFVEEIASDSLALKKSDSTVKKRRLPVTVLRRIKGVNGGETIKRGDLFEVPGAHRDVKMMKDDASGTTTKGSFPPRIMFRLEEHTQESESCTLTGKRCSGLKEESFLQLDTDASGAHAITIITESKQDRVKNFAPT